VLLNFLRFSSMLVPRTLAGGLPPILHCCILVLFLAATSQSSADERSSLRLRSETGDTSRLRTVIAEGLVYVAMNDLASSLTLPAAENASVGKFEIRFSNHRLKFTAGNPFLVITEVSTNAASVFQLSQSVRADEGIYFAPLTGLLQVLELVWPGRLMYDWSEDALISSASPVSPSFDVTGVNIESRLNGYLLTILASRKLTDVEAWLRLDREKWLFVTIANARADTLALGRVKPSGAVRQLLTFQSPTSVQLTFRVAPDVVKAELLNEPGTNNLMVALHTRSEAQQKELEKKRQELIRENLERDRNRWKLDVIVIDPGHGGKDPGTIGVGKTKEKDITLGIALKLGRLIEKNMKGVKVVYTRKTDTFVELYRRTQIANEAGGKLFVSIHCNSTERKPSPQNGFEIYLLRPGKTEDAVRIAEQENSVIQLEEGYKDRYQELTEDNFILYTLHQSAFMKYSEQFAEVAARTMAKHLGIRNSGVKQAGFYVLVGASMPNVLVETGYLSNRSEEKLLRSAAGQQKIADALYRGIREYKKLYEQELTGFEAAGSSP
jgi:N-acetylmuramoyl-L-alanine amidase